MENRLLVFISSLVDELVEEHSVVKAAIEGIPLTCSWAFEFMPASSDPLEESYLAKVHECDLFILLVGQAISGAVIQEYQMATNHQKHRLVFLKDVARMPDAEAFVRHIDVKWAKFSTLEELHHQVEEAVTDELIKGYRRYRLEATVLNALAEFREKLAARTIAAGDYIGISIESGVQNVVAGKNITQVTGSAHEAHFHGQIRGPVHAGSGDINIEQLSYTIGDTESARLRADFLVRTGGETYRAINHVVQGLHVEQIRELNKILDAIETGRIEQRRLTHLLAKLDAALAEAQARDMLYVTAEDVSHVNDVIKAPDLNVAHKLKLTLPLIPFLLSYEGEVQLATGLDLEAAWEWLKRKVWRS